MANKDVTKDDTKVATNDAAETETVEEEPVDNTLYASGANNTGAPYGQGWPPHTAEHHPEDEGAVPVEVYGAAALLTEPVPAAEPKDAKDAKVASDRKE